jgi:RNA polymerase sigma factor (sigma-70 family)
LAPPKSKDEHFARCASAFQEQYRYVHRTLLKVGVRRRDSEDLAQDVFLVMWRRWADFDDDRPLRPWLTGIALKVAADHQRKRSTSETPQERIELQDVRPHADDQLASESSRQLVMRALAQVPPKHRALLVMHELDDVPVDQLAKTLGVPKHTIYSRLRRARVLFARVVRRLEQLGHAAPLRPDVVTELEHELARPARRR